MNLVLEISDVVEQRLRAKHADIERSAKEALLIELYRQDELSHRELGQALGLDRFETDALLKQHHVTEDLTSASEYRAALESMEQIEMVCEIAEKREAETEAARINWNGLPKSSAPQGWFDDTDDPTKPS